MDEQFEKKYILGQGMRILTHINVTVKSGEYKEDLRIPVEIEVSRLIRELDSIFRLNITRPRYQIKIKNKGIILSEGKKLSDYPVTNGDIIEIR